MDKAEKDAQRLWDSLESRAEGAVDPIVILAAAFRQRDEELAQAREETTRLKAKLERTKEHHAKQRSENAEVEQQVFDEIAQELDKARAERDAAVEALKALCRCEYNPVTQRYDGDCDSCQALASLPQAAERAQAQRDVIAAARAQSECMMPVGADGACGCTKTHTCGMHATHKALCYALAALDALESGGG